MVATSLFNLALKEEINDIIENETKEIAVSKNSYGDDHGNLYFPLTSDEIYNDNDAFFKTLDNSSSAETITDTIRNNLKENIHTIGYNLESFDIFKFLSKVYTAKDIYGVLIKSDEDNDFIINPLHPMTALSIKLGQIEIPKRGKLIVYYWKDNFVNRYDTSENVYNAEYERVWVKFISQSKNFMNNVVSKRIIKTDLTSYFENLNNYDNMDQLRTFGNIKTENSNSGIENIKSILIPFQMVVDSIATPYYGMGVFKLNGSGDPQGKNRGIFTSGNFQSRSENNPTRSGAICTGSESNTRPTGWLTLNRVYLSSMWYSDIVTNHTESMIAMSVTAKKIAGRFYDLPEKTEETQTASHQQETSSNEEW